MSIGTKQRHIWIFPVIIVTASCGWEFKAQDQGQKSDAAICTAEFKTPVGFSLKVGEVAFADSENQFCRWTSDGFVSQFYSASGCPTVRKIASFETNRIKETSAFGRAPVCDGVERYDATTEQGRIRLKDLSASSAFYPIVLKIDDIDRSSLEFEILFAKQREGFPIQAVVYDLNRVVVFVEPKSNPWGESLCEALLRRLDERLPIELDGYCQREELPD